MDDKFFGSLRRFGYARVQARRIWELLDDDEREQVAESGIRLPELSGMINAAVDRGKATVDPPEPPAAEQPETYE